MRVPLWCPTASEPRFTTWKFRPSKTPPFAPRAAKHTIDYQWHSRNLKVVATWALPSEDTIGPAALPCSRYPSDHLSLATRFV